MAPAPIKLPIACTVCGAKLPSGWVVTCAYCSSEFDFNRPPAEGMVVKRGSTPGGRRVVEILIARFKESHQIDLTANDQAMQRVTEASERAARELAEKGKSKVNIPFLAMGPSGPVHLEMKLKKADLG